MVGELCFVHHYTVENRQWHFLPQNLLLKNIAAQETFLIINDENSCCCFFNLFDKQDSANVTAS